MDIQDINYPGFNRSLNELNAITKLKKKSCEILDFTEIEWVRDVLRQRINENNDLEIKFKTPTEKQIAEVSAVVGADIDLEDLKNNFHKNKRIIGITSGKGGVGKSTVTANLAVTLAKMGCSVGVLDADIYGPSMPTMFDMEGKRPLSVNVDGKSKMAPIENYGVKVLSIGFLSIL